MEFYLKEPCYEPLVLNHNKASYSDYIGVTTNLREKKITIQSVKLTEIVFYRSFKYFGRFYSRYFN